MSEMKENDFEKFEALLRVKTYRELTEQELQYISQWVESEREYEAMRLSGQQVTSWFKSNSVSTAEGESLQQLKKNLRLKHQQNESFVWLKPVWGYAASAFVFGLLGWWLGQVKPTSDPVTTVEQVLVRDTVYVASKPDTVFSEKIVYRDRPMVLTTQNRLPESKNDKGVSMKEKEELDNLLVSGSD